ncbi:MAG: hypothetical protein PHH54_01615 [Candidatus Nanoarchaeia archaeon]|nr:hypothetical protein [Candidatus Nanoarchaeia archaeon]MDD5740660.1 hypothetical protein [Candidatus Nanoarchaeia archaeon]
MTFTWYENLIANYVAGIGFSFTDRLFSENAKRFTKERLEKKLAQTEALNYLVNTEQNTSSKDYFSAIMKSKEYFEQNGISFENNEQTGAKGLVNRITEKVKYFKNHERINKLKTGKQFALAYGMQVAADAGVFLSQISLGYGHIGRAFALTPFQGLALFGGMLTGKGILYAKDRISSVWSKSSKDEKELDSMARELTKDNKLLDIVRNYSPTANLKVIESTEIAPEKSSQTEQKQLSSVEIGQKVGQKIVNAAEGVGKSISATISSIRQRIEERNKAEEDRRKALRRDQLKDLDNY